MRILVTRSEFARRAGIAPSTVTKACLKALAPATVGKRIAVNHPAAIAYLAKHTDDQTAVNGWTARNEQLKREALEKLHGVDFASMTLRELVRDYGTNPAFSDWLKSIKLIEDINEKRLKNEQTLIELVSRQLVKSGVVDPFDIANKKLLSEGVNIIAARVATMSKAGRSVTECQRYVADQISDYVRIMKVESVRVLQKKG